MQRGHNLEFQCQKCQEEVIFSIFEIEHNQHISCSHCSKKYSLHDENLIRQLKKFEALCYQIKDSEEILGNTSVGVDVGETKVKIPFKLLLTRLSSCLELKLGNEPVTITFRLEPLKDSPAKLL
ncbi:hypothetical protein PHSC3_000357 [Chlamydiales bacterium STE3]|nr:hypothetical protein PHSC3_000357 [Chlamydiales bacterium STE3]